MLSPPKTTPKLSRSRSSSSRGSGRGNCRRPSDSRGGATPDYPTARHIMSERLSDAFLWFVTLWLRLFGHEMIMVFFFYLWLSGGLGRRVLWCWRQRQVWTPDGLHHHLARLECDRVWQFDAEPDRERPRRGTLECRLSVESSNCYSRNLICPSELLFSFFSSYGNVHQNFSYQIPTAVDKKEEAKNRIVGVKIQNPKWVCFVASKWKGDKSNYAGAYIVRQKFPCMVIIYVLIQ